MDIVKFEDENASLEHTYYVKPFIKELSDLFNKSKGELKKYQSYLLGCLKILENSNIRLAQTPFELLNCDGYNLYRIKSPSKKKNVRVIYIYEYDDNGTDNIILLCAFEEKNRSDYQNNIKKAIKRIKEIGG